LLLVPQYLRPRNDGGVDGYHCCVEFYADGEWGPVDISDGDKYPRWIHITLGIILQTGWSSVAAEILNLSRDRFRDR
jgi:hypothetical protein